MRAYRKKKYSSLSEQLLESGGATVVTFIRILGAGIALIIILVLAD